MAPHAPLSLALLATAPFLTAPALAAPSATTSSAAPTRPAPGDPEDSASSWAHLDQELETLDQLPDGDADGGGPVLWGFMNFIYAYTDGQPVPGGGDLQGFLFDAVRLNVQGDTANYAYHLSFELFSGQLDLWDAYVRFKTGDHLNWWMGQFRTPFVRTGLVEQNRYLFLAPTRNGLYYRVRDASRQGAMGAFHNGPFHAQLAVQNGADVLANEYLVTLRGTFDVAGQGVGLIEGAYGAPSDLQATIGAAVSDDGSVDKGLAVVGEAAMTYDRFYAQAEVADYQDGYTAIDLAYGVITVPQEGRGGTTPWALTVSGLVDPQGTWEVAGRYEDLDDGFDRKVGTLGVNHYMNGHDAKLMVNFSRRSASGENDLELFAAGLSLSF